jgi:hypothetical protein
VNTQDRDGFTPLMNAVAMNQRLSTELLVEVGADVMLRDQQGSLAVDLATDDTIKRRLRERMGVQGRAYVPPGPPANFSSPSPKKTKESASATSEAEEAKKKAPPVVSMDEMVERDHPPTGRTVVVDNQHLVTQPPLGRSAMVGQDLPTITRPQPLPSATPTEHHQQQSQQSPQRLQAPATTPLARPLVFDEGSTAFGVSTHLPGLSATKAPRSEFAAAGSPHFGSLLMSTAPGLSLSSPHQQRAAPLLHSSPPPLLDQNAIYSSPQPVWVTEQVPVLSRESPAKSPAPPRKHSPYHPETRGGYGHTPMQGSSSFQASSPLSSSFSAPRPQPQVVLQTLLPNPPFSPNLLPSGATPTRSSPSSHVSYFIEREMRSTPARPSNSPQAEAAVHQRLLNSIEKISRLKVSESWDATK